MRWTVALVCLAMPAMASAQEAPTEGGALKAQAGLAVDWTTGPTFGDVPTLGGTHGLGVEGRLAAFGMLELDGRYEMLAIPLPGDMGNAYSHQLFGQLKLRWITDDVRRQLWAIGAGYGVAFRPDSLGGRANVGRVSLTRQIGMPKSVAYLAIEVAYERSFEDMQLEMVLGSIRFGLTSGSNARYQGAKSVVFARTTSLDLFAPGGAGMTLGVHAGDFSLETSANYMARAVIGTDSNYHGFRGAQWAVQTGPRYQAPRWPSPEAVMYGQVQAGIGWLARDPGELRPVQTAEVGVRIPCSHFGVDVGAWVRTDVEDGALHAIAGGLALKIVIATDRIVIGGRNRKCIDEATGSGAAPRETRTISNTADVSVQGQISGGIEAIDQALHPPATRVEQVNPRVGFVWIAGHWEWRESGWVWFGGRWEAERANMRWAPGRYEVRGNVSVWVEGRWVAR
jgi:hypothetical protein